MLTSIGIVAFVLLIAFLIFKPNDPPLTCEHGVVATGWCDECDGEPHV